MAEGSEPQRIVIDGARFRELASEKGFRNVEEIQYRAKELGKPLAASTIYAILANDRNFTKETLEWLCEVTGVPMEEFITITPAQEGG